MNVGGSSSQSELVDFAIWLLFNRVYRQSNRPPHLICHGYQYARGPQRTDDDICAVAGVPGIVSHYPNSNVNILKSAEWDGLLKLLGKDGEKVMLDMILHRGMFIAVEKGRGNLTQLSGRPLTDLEVLEPASTIARPKQAKLLCGDGQEPLHGASQNPRRPRSPAEILFVRSRMFYARAALNAKGRVTFGLRHIHTLNRYPNANNNAHTLNLLRYIFPRHFGLHNVFTSNVDPKETVQPFKDYTLREVEIARKEYELRSERGEAHAKRIPKRLHGRPVEMIQKLQKLHSRCSYVDLLKHYCPPKYPKPTHIQSTTEKAYEKKAADIDGQIPKSQQATTSLVRVSQNSVSGTNPSLFDLATPQANVSAFCRASISKFIPHEFWGQGDPGWCNKRHIMHSIDRFVRLRRFEPMSLHLVSQGLKVSQSYLSDSRL